MTAPTIAPAAVPLETVTPIRPSEALRLGRLSFPDRVARDYFTGATGACAVGAIAVGFGFDPEDIMVSLSTLRRKSGDPVFDGHVSRLFDEAEEQGLDGDAAVLAYLAERGL